MNQPATAPQPEMEEGEILYEIHCSNVGVEHPGTTLPWNSLTSARRRQWRATAQVYRDLVQAR